MPPARWRYTLPLRLRSLFRRGVVDRELDEELQFHIEQQIEANVARGMTPDAARIAALRAMGGLEQRKEECRDTRRVRVIEDFLMDVRYALRTMRRAPAFSAVAVLSLALGFGANTAIFSLLDAVLLKSLPVHDPQRLFVFQSPGTYPVSQVFRQQRSLVHVFASSGALALDVEAGAAPPERTAVALVSGSYFDVLGVRPLAGRTLTENDDRVPGAHPVAVASFAYWRRRFGGDPGLVGTSLWINGQPITILGVMPAGFFGERVGAAPDLWLPLSMWGEVVPGRNLLRSPGTSWLSLMGRLQPGVSRVQAETALTPLMRQALTDAFGPKIADDDRQDIARATVRLVPVNQASTRVRAEFSRPLQILMAVVALVLAIACANVANLLLARAVTRRREIAVRLAMGMRRGRLIRQLLAESLLLSGLAGLAGLVFAWWAREGLLALASADGSRLPVEAAFDARVLVFTGALAIGTGVLFGLAPARQSTHTDVATSLGNMRQTGGDGSRKDALSAWLVAGQVALALVLVFGAALFLRTLGNLRHVNLGFAPERLVILDMAAKPAAYRDVEYATVCRRLLQQMATLGGVASVTMSENGALAGRDSGTNRMRPEDFVPGAEGIPQARYDMVGPEYFGTMGISRLAGRDIDAGDEASAPRVVAINEHMARRFYGTRNPVGSRMLWGIGDSQRAYEVIAVVRNVKHRGLRDEDELRFYVPYFQHPERQLAGARFIVRTTAAPEALVDRLRQTIRAEDKRLSIGSVDVATDLVDRTLVRERMIATLSLAFGALALVLACVGLYGLIAYRVARRTREIGVRMAFGAARRSVLAMVVRQDLALVLAGILAGVPLALAASRLARSMLFGVSAADAATLAGSIAAIALAGLLAGLVPAWRATRIDPATALRHE
jgi:predicted permease